MGFVGTCDHMCPRSEMLAAYRQFSIFERDDQNQPDENAIVKEYRRAGADQKEPLADELRTPKALENTMNYLIWNIVNDKRSASQELALEWYDFLWDRLRAIRKDITQQSICNQDATKLVERCARFHVCSCYTMNRVKDFDVDMNKRNLNDCLQMLRQMYKDLRQIGVICPGESEFQKYDLLLHLDEDSLTANVLLKTSDHRLSEDMKFIIKIYNAYSNNNFYKFFKLLEEADYMTSCILCLFVNRVRLVGIKIIIAASASRQTLCPTRLVIDLLGFDDLEDLKAFADCLGIEVQEKDFDHYLVLKKDLLSTIRQREANLPGPKSRRLVEDKIGPDITLGHMVHGINDPIPTQTQGFNQREEPEVATEDGERCTSEYDEEYSQEYNQEYDEQYDEKYDEKYDENYDERYDENYEEEYEEQEEEGGEEEMDEEEEEEEKQDQMQMVSISSSSLSAAEDSADQSQKSYELKASKESQIIPKLEDKEKTYLVQMVSVVSSNSSNPENVVKQSETCSEVVVPNKSQIVNKLEEQKVEEEEEVEEEEDSSSSSDAVMWHVAKKKKTMKDFSMMPAGRFRTSYSKPKMMVPPVENKVYIAPVPVKQLSISNYKSQIDEEKKANDRMLKLIQIFSNVDT